MSDFYAPRSVEPLDYGHHALHALNRTRAAAGKPLLSEHEFEQRNRWLDVYRYADDPAERARAASELRRQDVSVQDSARAGRGCPPAIREQIARLIGRAWRPRGTERGGDPQRIGDVLAGGAVVGDGA